jgi:hypothetical protein
LTAILTQIPSDTTVLAARAVWVNQETADAIASNAVQVILQASKANSRFFYGKTSKCVLGGLFYLLGYRFNAAKTQREIAELLCTTEISVRKLYKSWLNEFPQFFTDVRVKMSVNKQTDYLSSSRVTGKTFEELVATWARSQTT